MKCPHGKVRPVTVAAALSRQSLSGVNYGNPNFVQIGAPRTISGTLSLAF